MRSFYAWPAPSSPNKHTEHTRLNHLQPKSAPLTFQEVQPAKQRHTCCMTACLISLHLGWLGGCSWVLRGRGTECTPYWNASNKCKDNAINDSVHTERGFSGLILHHDHDSSLVNERYQHSTPTLKLLVRTTHSCRTSLAQQSEWVVLESLPLQIRPFLSSHS